MSLPATSLPHGRDGNLPHHYDNIPRRSKHSSRRAAAHRKFRQRFDHFYNSGRAINGDRRELEEWQSGLEAAKLDPTIIRIEENALRERKNISVVPQIGSLASVKPDGVWRIGYCQLNNMSGSDTRRRKIKEMERIVQDYDLDGLALCEIGVNWSSGRGHSLKSWCSPYFSQEIRCTTSHNRHSPKSSLGQPGGTGILLTQSLLDYARDIECDFRHLGRWTSWQLSHTPDHVTRLVVAYCPSSGSADKGLKTVYRQHLTYIQKEGLNRTPYQLFFDDLISQLKKWRANNERLILCIDLNEHCLSGKISRRLRSDDILKLNERTHDFWPDGTEPNTHIDGTRPIDGIFATPDIDVTNCLLLSFHESAGDHRTMILEFTTASSIGRFQGKIVRPNSRRLTLLQPGAVNSYNATIREQFKLHKIESRLSALLLEAQKYSYPPPDPFRLKCNTIHTQIAEIRIHAESTCRKILKPALEFSPTVQFWYDRAHAYILLIKIKSGEAKRYTDISRAMRFAARKKITNPRSLTLEQCQDGLTACRLRQKELRQTSTSLRRQFTQSIVIMATNKGDTTRARAMKERMQRERNSSIWRRINRATRPSRGRACREVQRVINDHTYSFTTKESVESQIQDECSSRFQLGHNAPIASTLLGEQLQYLHNIDIAYSILMGTYDIPPWLDSSTQLILREIGKLGKLVLNGQHSDDFTISGADYTNYWKRINDRTSSSPSGLHITHYKASALDPYLAEQFAAQMNLIILSGIHPLRWGIALQVMLEKVAGVCLVDKLRSIQLYEADLNWFMKFIFNDIALTKLEESGMLPEEHYSNKGSTSEDACLEKTLTFDVSRQSRQPMAIISVDAAQCYDRVHPTLMSLVWLALTNHPHSVIILLHVLQQMKIFTRTGFGDSTTYFGGPSENPMCGLGQGSKAAPASWLQLSSMIVNAYKTQDGASTIQDPITGEITRSVGCMFVDYTDLYVMSPFLLCAVLVVLQAQFCVSMWSGLLNATGGAIKGSKSFWYLIDYECCRGEWKYKTFDDTCHQLYLPDPSGEHVVLERKEPDEAIKTLGVFHSPAGGHTQHLQHLHTKATDWLNKIKNGHLPNNYVLMSYYQQLWPGLRYGLGTLTNSYTTAEDCLTKFDFLLLPYIGVNRHIKREWRTLHSAFGGIGLLSLPIEQFICRTSIFQQHYNTVGNHRRIFAPPQTSGRMTRSGGLYTLVSTHAEDGNDDSHLLPASCTIIPSFDTNKHRVSLRNVGPTLSISNKLPASFWDILEDLGGNWMWQNMHLDFDASVEWFLSALSHESLLWVTDGSHNPLKAPDISGAGWIVTDCTTDRRWSCSFYEVSDHANSYRAELLGLYSIHVFILALSRYFELVTSTTINLRCDNKGALRTSSRRHKRIRPTSKCADILRCLRTVHTKLQHVHIHYAYVAAHMDDFKEWDELTLEQQLNVQCDYLAKNAVNHATNTHQAGAPHPNTELLPLEQCAIFVDSHKLTSDISHPLRFECSKRKAKHFLCTQRGWTSHQFDEVDWISLNNALSGKTMGFKLWLSKQHSNFCATRVQLHRHKTADDNKCPSCQIAAEDADHLCRCQNTERTQLLQDNTAELESWLASNNITHPELCYWIPHYILCRGQVKFADLGPMSPIMYEIALSQDSIGWRNFMEGRVSMKIASLQRSHLTLSGARLSVKSWMSQFISKILHITHSQWIFRNFMLHDKSMGLLRLKECTEAAIRIDELMQTRPSTIPAESQFLLEFDSEKLLIADTDTQQYWIAAMEAALAAKGTTHQPLLSSQHSRQSRRRWSASTSIAQIRRDINQFVPPPSWITSPTAISGTKQVSSRPTPHSIQQSLPSNKRRKPD